MTSSYASDHYESAQAYLQQAGPEMHLEQLNVQAQPGTCSLGFQVSDLITEWGLHTQELAMDSTSVGETKGIGIPLAYLLVSTSKVAHPGAKQKIIESWLTSLKSLGINPEFALTDKDQAEINAMRIVWPHSKHQLCFWHALKAIKRPLAKNKSTPTPYNAQKAHEHSQFIDPDFPPCRQQKPGQEIDKPTSKPLHLIVFVFNGQPRPLTQPTAVGKADDGDESDLEAHSQLVNLMKKR
ncbi:hypothetical protein M422DRAFT_253819 [Sphaerobolus stellatus SS14]|uniref:MULE transposase domain-containing protein n=1 Tax=Sphaerobolus stellatus (strain SS14) TaxID=990650 RepID=A0A0C9VWA6_SPHS4|nr:hypothetical protein M422DRAFT_253819 [Sphaerobolus stellatus SS14]